ncbi:unnamed protein product [Meloidogyne enterolobii]|uniref:Uncharacterized protein n=1 Tax=Meloidogyne enterolobii TaxID=390850 RepID=A0ACB1AGA4_MELEN
MRKRKVSASSTATNNIAVVASSTSPGPFNLGQILAKYGYVPRATFRPNIPPPTSSVLPPLQPTTTGIGTLLNGLPQPTSYFTQPILRNDICYTPEQLDLALFLQQQQRYPFRRIQQQLYQDALTFENQNIYEVCGNVGSECCDSNEEEEGGDGNEEKGKEEEEVGKCEEEEEDKCVEEEGKEEEEEEKENEEAVPQLQLKNVGQNENIIRQQAKETGVEVSPVLVPSSIPRITDDPRINGKGASSVSNNQATAAAVINRRISSPPPQTPIAGGGGFKGFQRQESVEAYQLAMAANGLNKQKRQHFEEKNEGIDKEINERSQKSIRANSIEQQIPKSLLNSYGPRRSEGPQPHQQQSSLSSQTCSNIQQLCPLSEATISLNWRQHEPGNTNKQTKQQQKLSADLRQTNIQQQQQQWTPLHSLSQQQQHSSSALITRNVQPLLSLSQALNSSSGQQHPPYSFNQFVQQLQAGNTRKIFDRNKSFGGRDQAIVPPPFRGAQNTNPYKSRTWSTSNSDWLNKQQKLGNNEGGGQWQGGGGRNVGIKRQHQQQRWIENDGIGIKGGSTSSKTVMRRSGSEYNVNNNTPIVMANNNVLLQQQQQQQQLFFDEKRGEGEMLEKQYQRQQQQQNKFQQHRKVRPPFASANRPTRPTSIRFPEGSNMSTEKEFGVVIDQHNFSNLKGLNKIDEQQQQPSSYNFEEHVEEFPALSLSQTNSRKACECHSEQPSPSSPKLLLDQQQQASLFSIKQPFSVVVAGGGGNGGRPRRATIGTSTATCTTPSGNGRKMNNNVENVYLTVGGGGEATRTPRSDTISCGSGGGQQEHQVLLGQQRRSYAQAMLKRNGSGVGGSVAGGEEERSSVLAKDRKNSTCKEGMENNNNQDDNNTNFPPISSLGTEV